MFSLISIIKTTKLHIFISPNTLRNSNFSHFVRWSVNKNIIYFSNPWSQGVLKHRAKDNIVIQYWKKKAIYLQAVPEKERKQNNKASSISPTWVSEKLSSLHRKFTDDKISRFYKTKYMFFLSCLKPKEVKSYSALSSLLVQPYNSYNKHSSLPE